MKSESHRSINNKSSGADFIYTLHYELKLGQNYNLKEMWVVVGLSQRLKPMVSEIFTSHMGSLWAPAYAYPVSTYAVKSTISKNYTFFPVS